jgi:hypothetical protein
MNIFKRSALLKFYLGKSPKINAVKGFGQKQFALPLFVN